MRQFNSTLTQVSKTTFILKIASDKIILEKNTPKQSRRSSIPRY